MQSIEREITVASRNERTGQGTKQSADAMHQLLTLHVSGPRDVSWTRCPDPAGHTSFSGACIVPIKIQVSSGVPTATLSACWHARLLHYSNDPMRCRCALVQDWRRGRRIW